MRKRYGIFISGTACLALVTGILIGKAVFSIDSARELSEITASAGINQVQQEPAGAGGNQGTQDGQEPQTGQEAQQQSVLIYDVEDGYMQVPFLPELTQHKYRWENLHEQKGLKVYLNEEGEVSKTGIDVSYFQNQIEWAKVKESGIDFVMVRLGYRGYGEAGNLVVDERFHQFMQEAGAAGLKTGVYFFSQAVTEEEAREEAEFVRQQCSQYELDYPVAFDTEKIKEEEARTDHLQPEELTEITIAFCEKIREYGYTPMIYANAKWFTTKLDLKRLQDYKIWYADYQAEPLYPYSFDMWQYTEGGQVDGIEGNVDLNIWFP